MTANCSSPRASATSSTNAARAGAVGSGQTLSGVAAKPGMSRRMNRSDGSTTGPSQRQSRTFPGPPCTAMRGGPSPTEV